MADPLSPALPFVACSRVPAVPRFQELPARSTPLLEAVQPMQAAARVVPPVLARRRVSGPVATQVATQAPTWIAAQPPSSSSLGRRTHSRCLRT